MALTETDRSLFIAAIVLNPEWKFGSTRRKEIVRQISPDLESMVNSKFNPLTAPYTVRTFIMTHNQKLDGFVWRER